MDFNKAYVQFVASQEWKATLVVPETLGGMTVERIPALPEKKPNFKKVILPESVKEIDRYAFDEWPKLKEVELPKQMKYIGAYAFSQTPLEELRLPDGIKYLGNSLCFGCKSLKKVYLGGGLETIGTGAFWGCPALRFIVIPASVRMIMPQAFLNCDSLAWARFLGEVPTISSNAFNGCSGVVLVEAPRTEYAVEDVSLENLMLEAYGIEGKAKPVAKHDFMSLFCQAAIPIATGSLMDIPLDSPQAEAWQAYAEEISRLSLKLPTVKADKLQIEKLLALAVRAKRLGQYLTAVRLCEEALALEEKNGVAFYNLAKILYLSGQEKGVLAAMFFAMLNVHKKHWLKLYGPIGHARLDDDRDIQGRHIGDILAYRLWAAGRSPDKPITGYELQCEVEGKRLLEEMDAGLRSALYKDAVLRDLQMEYNGTTNPRERARIASMLKDKNALEEHAMVYAKAYPRSTSTDIEIGKFDDDACYN